MGKGYLIDSNVLIDYMASRFDEATNDFVEKIFNDIFFISVIVKIEVSGFDDVPGKYQEMTEFINSAILLPLDDSVTQRTILLRKKYKK